MHNQQNNQQLNEGLRATDLKEMVHDVFEVEWAYKCFKGERIEQEVHKHFKKQRVNTQKEFFRVSLEEAKQIIEQIGAKYV